VFTHGYGFTVSTVNAFGPDGLPLYFVKDLGRSGKVQGIPQLGLSSLRVRQTLPVGLPRLYFGSAEAHYVIAPTQVREFEYPEGELNLYSHYDGSGGVPIHGPLDRLLADLPQPLGLELLGLLAGGGGLVVAAAARVAHRAVSLGAGVVSWSSAAGAA